MSQEGQVLFVGLFQLGASASALALSFDVPDTFVKSGDTCDLIITRSNASDVGSDSGQEWINIAIENPVAGTGSFSMDLNVYVSVVLQRLEGTYEGSINERLTSWYEGDVYKVRIEDKKLLNRLYENYLDQDYTLTLDASGEIVHIEAQVREAWPFPASLVKNRDFDFACNL